ncbi:MAG: T9SS type A sorting domain-containing protein [bacterium]|nr:T9SS type A sorting domain-containing protein [bacterium]
MRYINIIFIGIYAIVVAAFAAPFGDAPDWESNDVSASNKVILADFNGDGWQTETGEQNTGDGTAKCFYLEHYPAREIMEIRVGGTPLTLADYCCDPHNGWFSLATAPGNGVMVEVDYVWSNRLDMFVTNEYKAQVPGNDFIYFNTGTELNVDAGWQSDLDDRSGYCASADIDLDGDIDLITDGRFDEDDHIYVYYNDGSGLETTPSCITTADVTIGFSLGDMDKDGYPELAVADYTEDKFYVFDNINGTFSGTPIWWVYYKFPYSVAWGDYDCDGDLDLAVGTLHSAGEAGGDGFAYIFRNVSGVLESFPCWRNDPLKGRCKVAWGDFNGDGLLDLAKGIDGRGPDMDPYTDIYHNTGSGLPTSPSWESTLYGFVETFSVADYDGDGLKDIVNASLGIIGYFHLPNGDLETYPSWKINPVGYNLGSAVGDINNDGWYDVAFAYTGETSSPVGLPNLVFYNDGSGVGIDDDEYGKPNVPTGFALYQSYPNPARNSATISFALPETAAVNLTVFDINGRKVATLADEKLGAGEHERTVSGLAAGIYLYRLMAGENSAVRKMVVTE